VFGFVVGIRYTFNQREKFVESGFRQTIRIRIFFKNSRSSHVHPFVGTLCRQDYRYQQLKRIVIQQLGFGIWCMMLKIIDYELESLFSSHPDLE
jgi:hypothetical protein